MTKGEHENCYRMVVDCWRFFLKYAEPVAAEEYWQNMMQEAAQLGHRYNDHRLIVHLINAYLDYLDEKFKGRNV